MSLLLNDVVQHDMLMSMKKLFVLVFCFLMACEDQNTSRTIENGSRITSTDENHQVLTLECDQKLVNVTFDHVVHLGFLTRNMRPEEQPERYTFVSSTTNNWSGTYTVVESRCQSNPTTNNYVNSN